MIYTLCRKSVYDEVFEKMDQSREYCKKFGRNSTYMGSYVWKTYQDALNYKIANQLNDYEVYGVVASWIHDTLQSESGEFNNLLRDSRLVRLSDVKGYVK